MKKIIKDLLHHFGFKLSKISPYEFRYDWLKNYNINTIIDVGANQGQFAIEMGEKFPKAVIHSFEPVKSVFDLLVFKTKHLSIHCHQYGVGAENTTTEINHTINGNATSSLLEFGEGHHDNFAHWTDTVKEQISIVSLDSFFKDKSLKNNIFLKIDVQGYEDKVLMGAEEFLKKVTIVQLETSFVEMYKDQKLFTYFYDFLIERGFILIGTIDNFYNKSDGKPIYCDLLFQNKNLL